MKVMLNSVSTPITGVGKLTKAGPGTLVLAIRENHTDKAGR